MQLRGTSLIAKQALQATCAISLPLKGSRQQEQPMASRQSPHATQAAPPSAPVATTTALQRLYEEAVSHAVLVRHGTPLPAPAVARLMSLMGAIPLSELGFPDNALLDPASALRSVCLRRSPSMPPPPTASTSSSSPPSAPTEDVTYLHICENAFLELGIFCFPAGMAIPLHDHPGMTVCSRLLFGDLHVRSFDWTDHTQHDSSVPRRVKPGTTRHARLTFNQTVHATSAAPLVLYPEVGNLHEFTALTPCAVLDLLVPPYRPLANWDCTYYAETPRRLEAVGQQTMLRAIEQPLWFSVEHGEYRGLPVQAQQ